MHLIINYFQNSLLLVVIVMLSSCTPRVSKYFDSTRYVKRFNTHIVNDSLDLHIKTAGDIDYAHSKKDLANHIDDHSHHLPHLFAYGKTWVKPIYEIYFILDPMHPIKAKDPQEIVRDTTLNTHSLVMLCRTKKVINLSSLRSDCDKFFNSISDSTFQH